MRHARAVIVVLAAAAVLAGCHETPSEVGVLTEGSTGSSGTGTPGGATGSSSGPAPGETTSSPGTGEGSGTTQSALDSSGTSGTTAALDSSGSSTDATTGEVSPVGCADGTREALLDEALHPNVAACAGGFWVPGVASPVPLCDRQGGNDGPLPDGMGCTIEDLCAAGWHLCTSRQEVAAVGIADCNAEEWESQFFATSQSGEGANTCNDTGTNDVFGCGDVGYSNISGCAPLNRSTGNLCVELQGAWSCNEDAYDEVATLNKPGPDYGGALCCRDGS